METKRRKVSKSNVCCVIQGCHHKAAHSRKVKVIELIDGFEIAIMLCTRHKGYFEERKALVDIDLKAYGRELLLAEGKDKDKQQIVNETFEYMLRDAKAANREQSIQFLINAAKHFVKIGDGKFLFGFYFGALFAFSSFKDLFGTNEDRQRRAEEIRNQMSLKTLYLKREHPDRSNDLIDVCTCGHEGFMHASGAPRGECYLCLCPRYEFEQKLTRGEISDLQSLIWKELRKS